MIAVFRRSERRAAEQAAVRASRITALTDTAITLRPADDYPGRTVTPEQIQARAAEYGLTVSRDEAADALDNRLRHRGYR